VFFVLRRETHNRLHLLDGMLLPIIVSLIAFGC